MSFQRLALGTLVAVAAVAAVPRAEIIEQVLVKVNGEIFTKTDLEQRQVAALRQKNRSVNPADLQNDKQLQEMLREVTPQLLVDAVDELLILQRGVELGYKLSDEQFNQIVQQIRKENKLDSDEQFTAALKGEGMTVADLRRNIERSMIINRVQQQDVMEKIAITETETKAYYEAHKNEFTAPASVTLREILVAVPEKAPDGSANAGQAGVNVGLDEDAKAKVEAIRARVLKGENFANVAAKESDAASKANGGLIGPILPDELAPALVKALEAMKVGEVSQPMRAQRGWQIIKLEARADSVTPPLEQIRNQVTDRVYREKSRPELTRYLRRLREQAIIEWKNDELKKIYEEQVKTLEASPAAAEPESKTPDLKTPDPKTPGPKTR